MTALLGVPGQIVPTVSSAQQHLLPCSRVRACRHRHAVRCSAHSGDAQRPLVVVGSVNADLVLQVSRLPDAGETMTADSLDYFPGGKVRHTGHPYWTRHVADSTLPACNFVFCHVLYQSRLKLPQDSYCPTTGRQPGSSGGTAGLADPLCWAGTARLNADRERQAPALPKLPETPSKACSTTCLPPENPSKACSTMCPGRRGCKQQHAAGGAGWQRRRH
jgi:hypothetical protein